MNENSLSKTYIGIVEKEQAQIYTSMHKSVHMYYMNGGCVLECRYIPTSHSITSTHTLMVPVKPTMYSTDVGK